MNLKEQNILFFTRTMKLGGTENVVLQLCEIFQPLVNNIVVCSSGGVNVEKLDLMGIKHYEIPDIENKSPKTIMSVCIKLKDIVKKEKISIIHTHHRMAAFYVSLLGLYKKCSFINTSHNTFSDKVLFTRFAYKKAKLIACGEMVKKNLVEIFGLPEEQVSVIHNAVKPFEKEIIPEPLIEELHNKGCFVVGNIGRLSKQKGIVYYIQAIPNVLEQCPNARFLIVGSGEEETALKSLASSLEITEKLFFLGYRTDVQNLMKQMDLIVLSSLWEGLPLTPIEAFSVGKTIVATAVDGTVEIVEDGVNGLLISSENPEQISNNIIWMSEHTDERKIMEQNAFESFEKNFSFLIFSEKYVNSYKN